ncbi:flagellar hook-associated protein FlgK [Bacillus lacus]|uniref:Flagellar hook-associated protein 1 n=1 Tax=Metabacillus lacus TaxID=1983721 RepID=A0A7X2LYB3_9BACI|nr:flagellar hook-associated protein FlgK [Metabacillus lacus]MRX72186.1 flagellar hook-associated protein FlgK [Metabacillus lacus]
MRSTFMGLETAKRGMFAQQSALYTTGHNISNANTEGYSRQRVNFSATDPYPTASINRPQIPGQMGTGVEAGSVQRIRESFLDVQYRTENNKLGYWESKAAALTKMEDIMNEPSNYGLSKTMDRFWQSLHDLALNPSKENSGARAVVRERGIAVADTFQYLSGSLQSIQRDLKEEVNITAKTIDSLARQINNINRQIAETEPHGYLPNDLYDQRDLLLDQLSSLANIKITTEKSGGNALAIAEGAYTIELLNDKGQPLAVLVDGKTLQANSVEVGYHESGFTEKIIIGGQEINISDFTSTGKLRSLIDSYGYMDGAEVKGLYPEMLHELDKMAFAFVTEFNAVHQSGYNLKDFETDPLVKTPVNFFAELTDYKGAAGKISLSNEIKSSPDYIAAASAPYVGNGQNAIRLAEVKNSVMTIGGRSTSIQNFYESLIGKMAVETQEAQRLTGNSRSLRDSVENRRQSVSAVSLDEEMTNMIQFQHAYNASARMISLQDEILNTIINGLRGR